MSSPALPALVSALHLLSLAGGVTALLLRERALAGPLDEAGIKRVLAVDNVSGLIALTWMGSGLWRMLGGLEKGTDYYLGNHLFWGKMVLLGVGWGFEMLPMITFIKWRNQLRRGEKPDVSRVPLLRKLHWPELCCVLLIVPMASLMARGVGTPRPKVADAAAAEIARGEKVYVARCAPCHQMDGHGFAGKLAADFVDDKTRLQKDDQTLLRSIEHGVPSTAMRAFGGEIDEAERRAVLRFIRSRFGGGASPAPSAHRP